MILKQVHHPDLSVEDIEKYDFRVPRYTSYPTVPNWENSYTPKNYLRDLESANETKDPLSMYIHIPHCIRRCLFCACNVIVTGDRDKTERYMGYLSKEIERTADIINSRKGIQLHFGGGTPTHLTPDQLERLLNIIENNFSFTIDAEKSIEIHPSVTTREHIDVLTDHGFNRMSIGVQDFDEKVQDKLNRHQSYSETFDIIEYMRASGVKSINVDLIYGLPYQTKDGFFSTLDKLMNIQPDRVALYSYAHFPTLFRHHKHIPLEVINTGSSKLQLFLDTRKYFLEQEYEQIGFDHFSLKKDDLWKSYENKTLRRNFMGYTTKAGTDMLAFGYSSISELQTSYAQNSKNMIEYEMMVDKYGVATIKGHNLSQDDMMRKNIIMDLLCLGSINEKKIRDEFGDLSNSVINDINNKLPQFEEIGFVKQDKGIWELTPMGFVFGRIVASSFDSYYEQSEHIFSKSI